MKLSKWFNKAKPPDALKQVRISQYTLWANSDHPVEHYLNTHPYYSRNLARIARYIEHKYSSFTIIDAGANIGDSVALIRGEGVHQPIYCFEGEPGYYKILQANLTQFADVTAYQAYLGDNDGMQIMATTVSQGTARLNREGSAAIKIQQLSALAEEYHINNVKLLKTDTDGFDLKILRGSFTLISRDKPVLFFEYDAAYLEEQGEDGIAIFEQLKNLGYHKILYYDNFGKLLIAITTADTAQITQLYNYIRRQQGAFPYYDVAAFHQQDDELANWVLAQEAAFFT